jgi:phosphohistidine phosphatase SixA
MSTTWIFLRHCETLDGDNSSLSKKGNAQAETIGRVLYDMFSVPREHKPTLLRIALSHTIRVRETLHQACVMDGDMVVLDIPLLVKRGEAQAHATVILDRCVAYQSGIGAGLVLVVGHGETPAVLTEELHRRLTGEALTAEHTPPGHGYMLQDGKVFKVSPNHNPVIHPIA